MRYAVACLLIRQESSVDKHIVDLRTALHVWTADSVDEARGAAIARAMDKHPGFALHFVDVVEIPDPGMLDQ